MKKHIRVRHLSLSVYQIMRLPRFITAYLPKTATAPFCASEIRRTVRLKPGAGLWQRFRRYAGVGFLVSVGYMDPGNWATDIEAGSRYGYGLLCVVLIASLVAMALQTLCVRLGVVSGRDLAQLSRERFPPSVNFCLWVLAQIAIIACDFAEVLGTALALKLLLGVPLAGGILLTGLDTLLVLALQGRGFLRIEALVLSLIVVIAVAFGTELFLSEPNWGGVMRGFVPNMALLHDAQAWLIAIGIFGATVMPHNLYLHSAAVTSRDVAPEPAAKTDAIRLMTVDVFIALGLAFFVNAAILVVAATVFHAHGHNQVHEIDDAYYLLAPLLGTSVASIFFGIALFASGQSSTLTGTLAGQVILEGFLQLRIPCWQQRFLTRLLAIVPAWIGVFLMGEGALGRMLVLSQVVLSMQLPFAIVPLLIFNADAEVMGQWRLRRCWKYLCWLLCLAIIAANLYLLWALLSD